MPVTFLETPRFILREITHEDSNAMFEMDSDPDVHRYLGNTPVKSIDEILKAIEHIRAQYISNGIGRWAVISRDSKNFIGWAGLKLMKEPINGHIDHYDLGYRFLKKYWGKGIASECAAAITDYGFNVLKQKHLYAYTDSGNKASAKVLTKTGFEQLNSFHHEGSPCTWFWMRNPEMKLTL